MNCHEETQCGEITINLLPLIEFCPNTTASIKVYLKMF